MPRGVFWHIVFDFDGTLVDSLGTKAANAGEIFAATFGADPDRVVGRYYHHSGVARRLLFEHIAEDVLGHGLTEPAYLALDSAFTRLNLERVANAPPQPQAREVLAELVRRDIRMAVSSSAPEPDLLPRVTASGLASSFDAVLASRDGFRKGPEHVAYLAAHWKADLSGVLSIGDEVADARLAAQAGIACALVTHTITPAQATAAGPDYVLTGLEQLLALVGVGAGVGPPAGVR